MMLSPTYRVTVGDQRIDMSAEPLSSTLVAIDVRRDMAPLADRFALLVARVGSFAPEQGDDAVIELGFAGGEEGPATVMTGIVDEVDAGPERVRIVGFGAGAGLARSRGNDTFRDKTAAEIVTALASDAGVDIARTGTSETLPYYVCDARLSRYQHMTELARMTGFDLYCDTENDLIFEAFGNGRQVHPLKHGEHVLHYRVERTEAHGAEIEARGESPGAAAGEESWSWLVKDSAPQRGLSGSGAPQILVENAALRTVEAAQRAADAVRTRLLNRRIRGEVHVLGNPGIQLGDAIRLEKMPDSDLNATFQVRGVRHWITKAQGFVTRVSFRSMGGGAT